MSFRQRVDNEARLTRKLEDLGIKINTGKKDAKKEMTEEKSKKENKD
ncbi:hypothetical protein QS257_00115 [Terrilactibacillus sp. S3-3]|nr:hypothetical protein QS257_00115 [Terrilactibacillus sp. S3-3]